jgi:hypothetical protein
MEVKVYLTKFVLMIQLDMSTGFYSSFISVINVLLLPGVTHALRDHGVQET